MHVFALYDIVYMMFENLYGIWLIGIMHLGVTLCPVYIRCKLYHPACVNEMFLPSPSVPQQPI